MFRYTDVPWIVNGVISHSYKPPSTACPPCFYPCISITSASCTALPGGISGGRFANKAANKANPWTALGLQFFFSYFLWLVLCFPAVDWSVSGSVSDWWSYASKHVSSATPMLPACLETLNNWGKRRLLLKLCVSGWKSLLWGRRFLDSWSHYDLSPASRVLPVYSRYLIFIMFYNFLFIQSKRSITRIIGLLSSGSCSLVFTQGAAFTVYQECVLTPRAVCELEADTTMAVNHFWQFDCSRCTNTVCKTWNCSGDNNKGVILVPLWTHST